MDVKIILLLSHLFSGIFFFITEVAYFQEAIFWEAKKHLDLPVLQKCCLTVYVVIDRNWYYSECQQFYLMFYIEIRQTHGLWKWEVLLYFEGTYA